MDENQSLWVERRLALLIRTGVISNMATVKFMMYSSYSLISYPEKQSDYMRSFRILPLTSILVIYLLFFSSFCCRAS